MPKQENLNIELVNKYAFVSCELLCCDNSLITDKFLVNSEIDKLEMQLKATEELRLDKIREMERKASKRSSLFDESDDEDDLTKNKERIENGDKKKETDDSKIGQDSKKEEDEKERNKAFINFCDKNIADIKAILSKHRYPEFLERLFSSLKTNNADLLENELLSGYFYRFFIILYNKNPLYICKFLMENDYLKHILEASHNITIAEILNHILDTSSIFDVEIELENKLITISEEIFKFTFNLSTNDLIRYLDLYKTLATKILANKTPMITLLRKNEYLMKIVKNCFCGIDLTKVSTKNYSASIGKVSLSDYKKFKNIRLISLEILNNVIVKAISLSGEYSSVEECYLQFKPISIKFCMKVLINYYKMIDKFSWFYYDDKKGIDKEKENDKIENKKADNDFLDEEDMNLFYKVYDKTEVIKMFSTISLVLLAKKSMMGNLSKMSVNDSEQKQKELKTSVEEIDESYGFLNQFKNANGEDIIMNTIIGEYLLKIFPIFAFSFHLTEQKIYIASGCNENLDGEDPFTFKSTFNEDICIGLGEEKVLLIQLFLNLLNYFESKNAFISKISDTIKKVIDVSLVSFFNFLRNMF